MTMFTTLETLTVAWLPVLLDATIKGTAVLTLAGLLTLSMRRASAAPRHSVWFLAMAGLLLLPLLSLALPGWQILPTWCNLKVEIAAVCAADERPAHVLGVAEDRSPTISPPHSWESVVSEPTVVPATSDGGTLRPLPLWLAGLWVVGTLAAMAPIILGKLSLWWIERSARRIVDGPWIDLLKQTAGELKLQRTVALLQTDRCSSPLVTGTLRPKFVLPKEYLSWTLDRRQVVMLHELGHVKRWDCLTQMIAQIVRAVYWFNPLVWVAFRRMQIEAERACDDLVLAGGSAPCDYAEHLLQIAAARRTPRLAANSATAMARPSRLEGRLLAILDAKRSRSGLTRVGALLLASAIAGATAVIACVGAESNPAEIHVAADDNSDPELLAARNATQSSNESAKEEGRNSAEVRPPARADVQVDLLGNSDGSLKTIRFAGEDLGSGDKAFESLSRRVKEWAGAPDRPKVSDREVEILADHNLNYEFIARAISVLTGKMNPQTGKVERYIGKVKFAPPKDRSELTISVGFIRDKSGNKLSRTPIVFWSDQIVRIDDVEQYLRSWLKQQSLPAKDISLILRADSDAGARSIQGLIKQAQSAGFQRFTLRQVQPVE